MRAVNVDSIIKVVIFHGQSRVGWLVEADKPILQPITLYRDSEPELRTQSLENANGETPARWAIMINRLVLIIGLESFKFLPVGNG